MDNSELYKSLREHVDNRFKQHEDHEDSKIEALRKVLFESIDGIKTTVSTVQSEVEIVKGNQRRQDFVQYGIVGFMIILVIGLGIYFFSNL